MVLENAEGCWRLECKVSELQDAWSFQGLYYLGRDLHNHLASLACQGVDHQLTDKRTPPSSQP